MDILKTVLILAAIGGVVMIGGRAIDSLSRGRI